MTSTRVPSSVAYSTCYPPPLWYIAVLKYPYVAIYDLLFGQRMFSVTLPHVLLFYLISNPDIRQSIDFFPMVCHIHHTNFYEQFVNKFGLCVHDQGRPQFFTSCIPYFISVILQSPYLRLNICDPLFLKDEIWSPVVH